MRNKFFFELKRKLIHLLVLIFLVIYIIVEKYSGKNLALLSLSFILIFFLILDYFRVVKKIKIPFFHIFWREKEADKLGGNVYFLIGIIISFALFDFSVALAALLITTFGDMAAALFGIKFGKHFLTNDKSWEGISAEFIVNLIIGFLILDNFIIIMAMSLVAVFAEVFFTHIDDNLSIPLFAGFAGEILKIAVDL